MVEQLLAACEFDTAKFLIFSENVYDPFIYYSHLIPLIFGLAMGIFIFLSDKKGLVNRIFLFIVAVFSLYTYLDLILWATERIDITMFSWAVIVLIEPFMFAGCLYLVYVFLYKKDASLIAKTIVGAFLLPTIILAPTSFSLFGYDLTNCDRAALEGPLAMYGYGIELVFALWILVLAVKKYIVSDKIFRKEIIFLTAGVVLFMLMFNMGNIVGNFTGDWGGLSQWGYFGMPVLTGFVLYSIVKFKTFHTKMLSSVALVVTLLSLLCLGYFI